jgi:hypothetical protein
MTPLARRRHEVVSPDLPDAFARPGAYGDVQGARFNAPSGSTAAAHVPATAITEPVGIPTHLSLPPNRSPALDLSHDQQPPASIENGTNDKDT